MKDYVIFTDSACDVKPSLLSEWGIKMAPLSFRFSDAKSDHLDSDMEPERFYTHLRGGAMAKTSGVNPEYFKEKFSQILDTGKDILYIGFSSALSSTYNAACIAKRELEKESPKRRIETVDSLCASLGLGLLLYLVKSKKESGATLDEAKEFVNTISRKIYHGFAVDDLEFLARGGRISDARKFIGNLFGVKPILFVNDAGELKLQSKVMGRHAAIEALSEVYGKHAEDTADGVVFISHADCLEDANALKSMIAEKYGARVRLISDIGAVIGSHAGPGTLAIFFLAKGTRES